MMGYPDSVRMDAFIKKTLEEVRGLELSAQRSVRGGSAGNGAQ